MTVKEHYDKHLGNFYSWYTGNFDINKNNFKTFCVENSIKPGNTSFAIDLGAGNGIQTIALAELGFKVKAIDFNNLLLSELKSKVNDLPIDTTNDDIRNILKYSEFQPELIVCCGDTLPHLESKSEIKELISNSAKILKKNGRIVLSFRDYSAELSDTERFIPVKSDNNRILTCFIEYFGEKLRVTDLLHEFENGAWVQKASSYFKTRILKEETVKYLEESGFYLTLISENQQIITLIGQKK